MADLSAHAGGPGPERGAVLLRVQHLLQQILNLESAATIEPGARLREDLNIDSLGMVDVVLGVEEEFRIKLSSDINLFENVVTVQDAVNLVMELSASPRG
jgi:acyl carrier protein